MSTQIRTFLNPHIFYPDSCGRGLKPLWRAVSKQCGFGVWIHWFRVDGGPKRKKICGFKNIPIRADVALMEVARACRAPGERVCRAHRFTLTNSQEKMLLLHFLQGSIYSYYVPQSTLSAIKCSSSGSWNFRVCRYSQTCMKRTLACLQPSPPFRKNRRRGRLYTG